MTRQRLPGIDGILDSLLSTDYAPTGPDPNNGSASPEHPRVSQPAESRSARWKGARRGRPLGPHRCEASPKEKVTFRISCDLATEYRDWSWEARCQLSELVEQALVAYRESRRQRK
jgi:hypothetical protein